MRGINRSKKYREMIDFLVKEKNGVFSTIKALQCYAAMLGFEEGKRKKFNGDIKDNIEWHTFENDNSTDYIYMIALAEAKDVKVLNYDEKKSEHPKGFDHHDMVKIFEEYANGGFEILKNWIDNNASGETDGQEIILEFLKVKGYLNIETEEVKNPSEVDF